MSKAAWEIPEWREGWIDEEMGYYARFRRDGTYQLLRLPLTQEVLLTAHAFEFGCPIPSQEQLLEKINSLYMVYYQNTSVYIKDEYPEGFIAKYVIGEFYRWLHNDDGRIKLYTKLFRSTSEFVFAFTFEKLYSRIWDDEAGEWREKGKHKEIDKD
jgi:hypothetical protein